MTEYVDLSERVTATFYRDEYEEWTQRTATIADVLDSVCDDYTVLPFARPEIVHCKDCKWKQGAECVRFAEIRVFPDDFCSRAERR